LGFCRMLNPACRSCLAKRRGVVRGASIRTLHTVAGSASVPGGFANSVHGKSQLSDQRCRAGTVLLHVRY
jgi:hypothetical protein